MPTLLETVGESILAPGGLTVDDLVPLIGELAVGDIDFADLFFERAEAETFCLKTVRLRTQVIIATLGLV